MSDQRPVIAVDGVTKSYAMGEMTVHALRGVSLRIERGDHVAIMGSSGSGKSTLMNILGCLDVPTRGRYLLDGIDVRAYDDDDLADIRNRKIGFVFQSFNLVPRTRALANVELPLAYAGVGRAERRRRATRALRAVGMGDRLGHLPSELSGGQQQRVAVARAIVASPPLLLADEPTGNLDSRSTDDVLGIFSALSDQGRTIVMITHEPEVAERAKRVIRLIDGRIVEDRRLDGAPDPPPPARPPERRGVIGAETLRIAIGGILANKLRSGLTILGLTIGVASVIVLIAVGNGSSRQVTAQIEALGSNVLLVMSGSAPGGSGASNAATKPLTTRDAAALVDAEQAPAVQSASPTVSASATIVSGSTSYSPSTFVGTTPAYAQARDYDVAQGEFFTKTDVSDRERVVVLGQTVVDDLGAGVGQTVQIGGVNFRVVGVLAEKGASGTQDQDDVALAPYTAVQDTLSGYGDVDSITVQARSREQLDAAQAQVTAILDDRHKLADGASSDFQVINQGSILEASSATSGVFTTLLAQVAAISLLVGGIGVMNIMLVSVTERTREIGIRKAIGARRGDILSQFLVEAVLVSLLGGICGVLVGIGGTRFRIAGVAPVIAPYSIPLAFGAAIATGLFFGTYPASRAARLRPIEALRFE